MDPIFTDAYFMKKALQEAEMAFEKGEIPVGAVVVVEDRIIARSHNLTELLHKYLKNCSLYVTLEPCQMCAGALYWSQLSKVVYGASDDQRGFVQLGTQLHPKTVVVSGVMADEAAELMKRFFAQRRK